MDDYIPNTEITDDDKLWSLLCYIFPLISILMLFMEEKKNRPFIKYHAVQSLVFGGAAYIISSILSVVFFLGCLTALLTLGYSIYLGIKAYNGELVEIPVITQFCKDQGWID